LKRFLIQLYRVSPGDVGIPDLAATANTFREAERQAIRHLETYFGDQQIAAEQRPRHARLLDQDGSVLVGFMKLERGVEKIEVGTDDAAPP
jgi:hypothetical protein